MCENSALEFTFTKCNNSFT